MRLVWLNSKVVSVLDWRSSCFMRCHPLHCASQSHTHTHTHTHMYITHSHGVAKATKQVNGKGRNSIPRHAKPIFTKIDTRDYVMDGTRHEKICVDRFRGFCSSNTRLWRAFGMTNFYRFFYAKYVRSSGVGRIFVWGPQPPSTSSLPPFFCPPLPPISFPPLRSRLPQFQLGELLSAPPAGSGAEPQPKSNLVHFRLKI